MKNVRKIEYVRMWVRKSRERRKVKIQVEEIVSVRGQFMGIGMLIAVSMLIKNVDVFMKEIQLRDIK